MGPRISAHAQQRMRERGITPEDITAALRRPVRGPLPGSTGALVFEGYTRDRRLLRVVLSADRGTVISTMWRNEGGTP